MGSSSCVESGLGKMYQEEWKIIMMLSRDDEFNS